MAQRIRVEPLTCSIGAELSDVDLGEASRDDALFAEIRALLLQYKVLFLRDQHFSRAEHVAFARRFGAARGPSGRRQRPGASGPGAHLQGRRQPPAAVRERLALRHHLARVPADGCGAALRRMRRRSAAT